MRGPTRAFTVLVALLLPLLGAAQQRPPQQPGAGNPPGPRREGHPPPPVDALYFKMQTLHAIEGKVDILLEMGRVPEAVEELQQVLVVDIPKGSPGYEVKCHLVGRLAMAYADLGRRTEALETVMKLLSDAPPGTPAEAAAWLEAGSVYKKLHMPEEALRAFDRAIELSKKLSATGWKPPPPPGQPGGPRSGPGGGRPDAGGGPPRGGM